MAPDKTPLSDEERRCRQEAIDYAVASVELLGFRLDAAAQARDAESAHDF
jgi:hypothetical protein